MILSKNAHFYKNMFLKTGLKSIKINHSFATVPNNQKYLFHDEQFHGLRCQVVVARLFDKKAV